MKAMPPSMRRGAVRFLRARNRSLALIPLAAALALAGCQSGDSLVGSTWQWTAEEVTNSAGQPVTSNPANYTIEFRTDGTVNVRADCNSLTGTYGVNVPLDLTITLARATLPTCGDESLDVLYLDSLGRISSYSTGGGELKLFFDDGDDAMRFKRASA